MKKSLIYCSSNLSNHKRKKDFLKDGMVYLFTVFFLCMLLSFTCMEVTGYLVFHSLPVYQERSVQEFFRDYDSGLCLNTERPEG